MAKRKTIWRLMKTAPANEIIIVKTKDGLVAPGQYDFDRFAAIIRLEGRDKILVRYVNPTHWRPMPEA